MPRQQGRTVCFQWYQLSCRELFKLAAVNPASLTCPVPFDSYFRREHRKNTFPCRIFSELPRVTIENTLFILQGWGFNSRSFARYRWIQRTDGTQEVEKAEDCRGVSVKTQVEINNFTALCLVAWPLKKSEAGVELVLMTSSLFLCKLLLISMRRASIGSLRKHDVDGSENVIWKCNFAFL